MEIISPMDIDQSLKKLSNFYYLDPALSKIEKSQELEVYSLIYCQHL